MMIFLSAAAILFDLKDGVFAYDTEEEIRQQVGKNNFYPKYSTRDKIQDFSHHMNLIRLTRVNRSVFRKKPINLSVKCASP